MTENRATGIRRQVKKIVSGGQTGVDRAALDWAIAAGIEHGGWCPQGRAAEDGAIPQRYRLMVLAGAGYRKRTRRNVEDSDGTLILNLGELDGGTRETVKFADRLQKHYLLIQLDAIDATAATASLLDWLKTAQVRVLNVAGPREGKRPGAYAAALGFLHAITDRTRQVARASTRPDAPPHKS